MNDSNRRNGGMSVPLRNLGSMQLEREHTRSKTSQDGKRLSQLSKVIVIPTAHFDNIHTNIYKKVHTYMCKQILHISLE